MTIGIVATFFVVVMGVLAYRANRRFSGNARLPMQWGWTGRVNWSAPRHLALDFMPTLATALFGFLTFLSITTVPRAEQGHMVLPIVLGMGCLLIAAQLVHFRLIDRTLR